MRITKTDLTATFAPPSVVSAAALLAGTQYGDAAVVAEFTTAVAAGAISWTAFGGKWAMPLAWGSGAAALAFTQAGVTSLAGIDPVSLYAWLFSAAVSLVGRLVYRHHTRHDALDRRIRLIDAETRKTRLDMASLKLQAELTKTNAAADVVNLQGHTPEETALRTAVYELFKAELLGCVVERTDTGWAATLDLPATLHRDKLRRAWPQMAGALGVPGEFDLADGVRSNQLEVRYLDADPLARLVPYEPEASGLFYDAPVRLGVDRWGGFVEFTIAGGHVLVAGISRGGKSNVTKLVALRLAGRADTDLYGVDMKPGAPEMNKVRPILKDLASGADQAHALFDWLRQEIEERGEILKQRGHTKWDPKQHGRPAVFVFVDELAELIAEGDKNREKGDRMSDKLGSLLRLTLGYGIHLVLATQQPDKSVFGGTTSARGNITVRICTRTDEAGHGRFVFSDASWKPHELDAPGKFLMRTMDHRRPEPYKAQFVPDDVADTEMTRLAREMVPAPAGKRLVLPAPAGLSNQDAIRDRLDQYGNMTRRELEQATGLNEKQVLDAQRRMPDVERDERAGTYRLVVSGAWDAQAVAVPSE